MSQWKRRLQTGLMVLLLAGAVFTWLTPDWRSVLGLPQPDGVLVSDRFALCEEPGYSSHCVVDGDTFRIGQRRIRIQGIDAPEREGQCEAESALARRSARALQEWLNRNPFAMMPQADVPRDQYGRELQDIWREDASGARDDLARHMRTIGMASEFGSGMLQDWC